MSGPREHISLLYHDVVDGPSSQSGFSGAAADRYKLGREPFDAHLSAIAARQRRPAISIFEAGASSAFHITFDDGGASSLAIADRLEQRGWIGHFFIATDWIGKPGFLDGDGIRTLAARGHVVGSHSCSHPLRMASLAGPALRREWSESRARLADILGAPVLSASIPGGGYSRRVAEAADAAGYSHLFTSEPSARPWLVGNLILLGRYSVMATTSPARAAALAVGDPRETLKLRLAWSAKRAAKSLVGPVWERARDRVLSGMPSR